MIALGIDIDLSTDFLEDRLTDNCKCEITHDHWCPICSIEVTHRAYTCIDATGANVCSNLVESAHKYFESKGICDECDRLASDCWRLVKI